MWHERDKHTHIGREREREREREGIEKEPKLMMFTFTAVRAYLFVYIEARLCACSVRVNVLHVVPLRPPPNPSSPYAVKYTHVSLTSFGVSHDVGRRGANSNQHLHIPIRRQLLPCEELVGNVQHQRLEFPPARVVVGDVVLHR